MNKKIKMSYPEYLKEFKCIGGSCEDSCCIGWDIDIDKVTFKEYFKVKDPEMKKMFQKNIYNNEDCSSEDVDYGKVKLRKDKRCPFLDDKNLCVIYSKVGEEYLSNVCTCYPRITNKVDEKYEMSLDIACPEAARMILGREEGIKFNTSDEVIGKHIISGYMDTKAKEFSNTGVKYFKEIRDLSIKILQNRNLELTDRLYVLGTFLEALEEIVDEDYDKVPKFINEFNINEITGYYEKNKLNYILQVAFFKDIIGKLNVFEEVDSDIFKKYTRKLLEGFDFKENEDITENSKDYVEAFTNYESFMDEYSYVFENYLVNFIYNNLFPFSEDESMFNGYIVLLVRFSFIRFYLAGIYGKNKTEGKDDIIRFIQVFSKVLEHHKTFWVEVLGDIIVKEFDNMEFAKTLL